MDMAPYVNRSLLALIQCVLFQLVGIGGSFSNHVTPVGKPTLLGVLTPNNEADTLGGKILSTVAPSRQVKQDLYGLRVRCLNIHEHAKGLKVMPGRILAFANLTISCYWENFLEIQSSSENRGKNIGRQHLPAECLTMEVEALSVGDIAISLFLKVNSYKCVMESHIFILCSRLGRNDCKKAVMICSSLKPKDSDRLQNSVLFYLSTADYVKCLLETVIAFRSIYDDRPPLQGTQALAPLTVLDGWYKMWRTGGNIKLDSLVPLKAGVDSLKTVRFVGDASIQCKPTWRKRHTDHFTYISDFMKIIAQHVGAPVECTNVPQDDRGDATLRVQLGIADVYVTDEWPVSALVLYPHDQDDLCLLVHKQMPERRNIVNAYTITTWIATGVALLTFATVVRLAGGQPALLHVLRAFITGAFDVRQRPLRNFLFIIVSWFGLIVLNAFAGVFTSFLTVPGEKTQWQTLEEVDKHVELVMGSPSLSNLKNDNGAMFRLLEKVGRGKALWVTRYDNVSVAESRSQLEYLCIHPAMMDETGRPLTHIVPQCLVSPGFISSIARVHWHGRERFIVMIQTLLQAGVHEKAKRAFRHQTLRGTRKRSDGKRALAMADIAQAAILLAGGLLLAGAAFALECACARTKRR